MALLTSGVKDRKGQVAISLPTTGQSLRLPAGNASIITRDVCEVLAPAMFSQPVVVHVSASDQKTFGELTALAGKLGLTFDPQADLPDVVIAETSERLILMYVEVVHSDGVVHVSRAKALLKIAEEAGIPPENVMLVTAFEDRNSKAFKKRVSELAPGSLVWFRSEPSLLMELRTLGG